MMWALVIGLGAVLVTALTLVALALMLGPALESPAGIGPSALTSLVAVCGVAVGQILMAIIFLLGFHQAYVGRHEYGLAHARSLERALVFLVVYFVLTAVTYLYALTNSFLKPGLAGLPAIDLLSGNPLLAPVGAAFAGLTLVSTLRAVAEPSTGRRTWTALALGVAGAAAGPLLLAFSVSGVLSSLDAVVSGLLASAVAGQGVCALSLLLFIFAFRDVRSGLESGRPAPVLPRIEKAYPWMYRSPYPVPPPAAGNPPQPPRP